jgi:uncharacterized membrane protein
MKNEIIDKLSALSIAAFGLVAALAWNGAIRTIFERYYGAGEGIVAMLTYAIVVTFIAVFVTIGIAKFSEKSKQINLKEKIRLEKLRCVRLDKKKG